MFIVPPGDGRGRLAPFARGRRFLLSVPPLLFSLSPSSPPGSPTKRVKCVNFSILPCGARRPRRGPSEGLFTAAARRDAPRTPSTRRPAYAIDATRFEASDSSGARTRRASRTWFIARTARQFQDVVATDRKGGGVFRTLGAHCSQEMRAIARRPSSFLSGARFQVRFDTKAVFSGASNDVCRARRRLLDGRGCLMSI
jgi:hypothetical protein